MIRVGGEQFGGAGDVEFCGLIYPDGDEISKHMASRLRLEPFYQHDKFKQAMAFVRNRRGAIDCGAWVGGWSRELAKTFAQVLAIEANSDSARCAKKNLSQMPNATVLHLAVGDRNASGLAARERNGSNVGSRVTHTGQRGRDSVSVRRLDDIPEVRAISAIDYIKIHVNGMELKALRGAEDTIRKHRPTLTAVLKPAIEDYDDTADAARTFLKSLGYGCAGGERPYEIWTPR